MRDLKPPASANGLLLWHTPNNAGTTHCLQVPQSPTQPELRMHSTERHMLSSSRTQLRTTVPLIAHSASQLHSQLHRAPTIRRRTPQLAAPHIVTSPCQPQPPPAPFRPTRQVFLSFSSFALTKHAKIRGSKF